MAGRAGAVDGGGADGAFAHCPATKCRLKIWWKTVTERSYGVPQGVPLAERSNDLVRNRWDWIALLHTMRPVTYLNGSALHSIG